MKHELKSTKESDSLLNEQRGDRSEPWISYWKNVVQAPRRWNPLSMPMPIYALYILKTDEDRYCYLRSLPVGSLNQLTTAMVYVLLKGGVLEKAIQLGIAVPEAVSGFLGRVELQVRQTGEVTIQNVQRAVQAAQDTAVAMLVIGFTIAVILHPLLAALIAPFLLSADLFSFFYETNEKPNKNA